MGSKISKCKVRPWGNPRRGGAVFFAVFLLLVTGQISWAFEEQIVKVIDGDTLQLSSGDIVSLIGIDAPESRPNAKAKNLAERRGLPLEDIMSVGNKTKAFVDELVKDKAVWIDHDVTLRNKEGHLLAYVFIDTNVPASQEIKPVEGYEYVSTNGKWYVFVNATIVKSGFATPLNTPPNVKYEELMKKDFEDARKRKRGLWK